MLHYLERLRKKPENIRKKNVLLISIAITALIFLIWGITLYLRLDESDFIFQGESNNGRSPGLGESFSNISSGIKEMFKEDPQSVASTSSVEGLEE